MRFPRSESNFNNMNKRINLKLSYIETLDIGKGQIQNVIHNRRHHGTEVCFIVTGN